MNQYSASVPLSQRQYYRPNETVDFTLSAGVGMAIVANSIRICGQVIFTGDTTAANPAPSITNTTTVFLDGMVGAHGFFKQIVVETQQQGVLQNLQDYPRCIADIKNATKTPDMVLNSDQKALCTGNSAYSCNIVGSQTPANPGANPPVPVGIPPSFCINPEVCINRTRGVSIQYSKTGDIKLNLVLNSARGCMFGAGLVNNAGFVLQNLECHYKVVPDQLAKPVKELQMMTMASVKAVADGSLAAFNIVSPIPSYALSANFIALANETAAGANSLLLESVPGLSRVELTFQDTNNQIIQFPLENLVEIYKFWVDSYGSTRYNPSAGSCIGVAYNQVLSNTKFGVVIQSGIAASTAVYFVFKGMITI